MELLSRPGPSRATAGPWETFSLGPQTFSQSPLERKFLNCSFQNGTFYISGRRRPTPNVAGPGVAYPYPTLSTGLVQAPW